MPPTLQRADCRHRERLLLLLRSSPQRAGRKRRLRASAAPRASRRSGRTSALLAHDNLADDRARLAAAPCVRRRSKWRRRAKLGDVCCERRSSLSLLVADSLPDRSPQHEGTTVPKGVSRVAMESFPTEDRRRTAWLTSLEGPIAPSTVSSATFCSPQPLSLLRLVVAPTRKRALALSKRLAASEPPFRSSAILADTIALQANASVPKDSPTRRSRPDQTPLPQPRPAFVTLLVSSPARLCQSRGRRRRASAGPRASCSADRAPPTLSCAHRRFRRSTRAPRRRGRRRVAGDITAPVRPIAPPARL